jgi:hypothetical protein
VNPHCAAIDGAGGRTAVVIAAPQPSATNTDSREASPVKIDSPDVADRAGGIQLVADFEPKTDRHSMFPTLDLESRYGHYIFVLLPVEYCDVAVNPVLQPNVPARFAR